MNEGVITMVKCPYCNIEWISDTTLTCDDCAPDVLTDMALSSLMQAIENLTVTKNITTERFDLLDQAVNRLISLRENLQKVI
jgi:hypothetical protein